MWISTGYYAPGQSGTRVAYLVTTPSPGACSWSMPKSVQRWVLNMSYSRKDPASSKTSTLSLAESLPLECCLARRLSPPPSKARLFVSSSVSLKVRLISGRLTTGAAGACELSRRVVVLLEEGARAVDEMPSSRCHRWAKENAAGSRARRCACVRVLGKGAGLSVRVMVDVGG